MKDLLVVLNEDGSYGLTTAGYVLFAVIIFALMAAAIVLYDKKQKKTSGRLKTKQLTYAAVAMALAMATSGIKLFHMPFGGSITLFSMLFIAVIGYFYGPSFGLLIGIAYGLLQLVVNPYIISVPQLLIDYPLAFGALGLSGFFADKKHGLIKGYLAGVTGRWFFSTLSGVIFFGYYAADFNMSPLPYSMIYNGCYMGGEALMTCAVLLIPAVSKAFARVKNQALA